MLLANFLDAKTIAFEQQYLGREQVYTDIINRICRQMHETHPKCGQPMLSSILAREKESPMAYSTGIAIPHIRVEGLEDTLIGMTFLQNPLDYDGLKVHWIVLIITDKSSSKTYLNIVAALLKLSKDKDALLYLHSLKDGHAVVQYLRHLEINIGKEVCIADIMVKEPKCIGPSAKLKELDSLINEYKVSLIPVIDENSKYLGEVNILDVLKVGVPDYMMMMDDLSFLKSYEPLETIFEQEESLLVTDMMQQDATYLKPDDSIVEAVYHMIQSRRRSFCVVDNGKLVGLITAMDIFRKVIKA